ncbi:MAG: AAA family ATPase, partial [Candidatus Kariarchaeaceae archaeon]
MSITLSKEQTEIYDAINKWLNAIDQPYLTMGGYAGTGKTTIIQELCDARYDLSIHVCALTGKATLNVGAKLNSENVIVSTIHKLLYKPITDADGNLIGWTTIKFKETGYKPNLIIVDEASMVSEQIFIDLLNTDIPILFVGDHGQLPPIVKKGDEVDDDRIKPHKNGLGFNLMRDPQLRLEEIHRQALGSPIIRMSMLARQGTWINNGVFGNGVMKINSILAVEHLMKKFDEDQIILTDLNRRRTKLNRLSLKYNGFDEDTPTEGVKVVCLKNNFQNQP